jgi:hypothetical protein
VRLDARCGARCQIAKRAVRTYDTTPTVAFVRLPPAGLHRACFGISKQTKPARTYAMKYMLQISAVARGKKQGSASVCNNEAAKLHCRVRNAGGQQRNSPRHAAVTFSSAECTFAAMSPVGKRANAALRAAIAPAPPARAAAAQRSERVKSKCCAAPGRLSFAQPRARRARSSQRSPPEWRPRGQRQPCF